MVRTILAGLLVAGATPVTAVNTPTATAIDNNPKNVLLSLVKTTPVDFAPLCNGPSFGIVCSSFSTFKPTKNSSDFSLPNLARLLRPRFITSKCVNGSLEQLLPDQENQFNLSDYRSQCIFPWQSKFPQQSIAKNKNTILSQRKSQKLTKSKSRKSSVISRQFPKLSRSSLIVSFPLPDTSLEVKSEKLANPAPATKRIASPFGWRSRPYSNQLQFHQGIDYGAPLGSPVVAVGNGIVTKVSSGCADFGNLFCGGQLGNWIEIDHGNGAIATYGHLKNSSITIKQGMKVQKNQQIAQVGSSGWSTGAHLDFRLKINGEYDNPAKYVVAISKSKI